MRKILSVILFFVPILLVAQIQQDTLAGGTQQKKRIRIINSDYTKTIESDSGTISRFRGNIMMEHENVIMECDSAELSPSGIFEAFGNAKITNNTTVVTGDTMIYNQMTGKAKVWGRIVYLTDEGSTLKTSEVDFDTETEIGYFEHEGVIIDSFRILESRKGYYYSKTKYFEFIGQVQSDTKDYVLQSDSMTYNTNTKIFNFYRNTHIWSGNGYLYCDKGWYDSDRDIMFFHRNSYMLAEKQEIFADSIYYENGGRKGRLYSNVQAIDTAQKTIALADFADFDMNTENFLMRKNPSIIIYDDRDSVFLRADTLYSVTQTLKIPVSKKDTAVLAPDTIVNIIDTVAPVPDSIVHIIDTVATVPDSIVHITDTIAPKSTVYITDTAAFVSTPAPDSLSVFPVQDTIEYMDSTYKELFAFGNAKLYRNDFQLICDSMYYNNVDSIWKVYQDPILWNGKKMQIISDSMKFYMINGDFDHADFNGNAMLVTPEGDPDSTIYFNQVKSKNMKAHLKNRKLSVFEAMGNLQTLAFSLADFTMNKAEAGSLKIIFDESGKTRRIAYYEQVNAGNNPFTLVMENEIQLPGYRWEIDLRPKSGSEVLNRPLRPSERAVREALTKPSFPIMKRIEELEDKIKNK
ncbi:MAG: hypothetical protein LBK58_14305 [Prevotellaceae bacterium]|jgi:lipopolysaccharide export system protein LptA|nr:hypothetical protein [Prevotellaceae bacterium]